MLQTHATTSRRGGEAGVADPTNPGNGEGVLGAEPQAAPRAGQPTTSPALRAVTARMSPSCHTAGGQLGEQVAGDGSRFITAGWELTAKRGQESSDAARPSRRRARPQCAQRRRRRGGRRAGGPALVSEGRRMRSCGAGGSVIPESRGRDVPTSKTEQRENAGELRGGLPRGHGVGGTGGLRPRPEAEVRMVGGMK